jgi:hypothetical protein
MSFLYPSNADSSVAGAQLHSLAHPVASLVITGQKRQLLQERAIVNEIRKLGHDPLKLPAEPRGKPGVKAAVLSQLDVRVSPFSGEKTFKKAWERLLAAKVIARQN